MRGMTVKKAKAGALIYPVDNPAQLAAHGFASCAKGMFASGGFAWVKFPSPTGGELYARSLWLTRMPGKTYEGVGADCLLYSTLRPVDTVCDILRYRTRSTRRPRRAAHRDKHSFTWQYYDPMVVLAELSIYLFGYNYHLMSSDQPHIAAEVLGLMPSPPERIPAFPEIVCNFRLGVPHAERMTEWLRQ